jgi:hypothetical protein
VPGEDGYFDERIAARYDESSAEMFDASAVDPVVDLLAELAAGLVHDRDRRGVPDREEVRDEADERTFTVDSVT